MRSKTQHYEILMDGTEITLEYEAVGEVHTRKVADKYVVAYLTLDGGGCYDDLIGDCMGYIYSSHRFSGQHRQMQEALGLDDLWNPDTHTIYTKHFGKVVERYTAKLFEKHELSELVAAFELESNADEDSVRKAAYEDCDRARDWGDVVFYEDMHTVLSAMFQEPEYFPGDKDAIVLDCYSHGSEWWSIAGKGEQCPWDTANGAGVWVPDKCLREQLDNDEQKGKDRRKQAELYAEQLLELHNDIINGAVYGCIVQVHDENGACETIDSCWGYIGLARAEESLNEEWFEPTCEGIQEQYDRDVRTQCGRQQELPL